MKHSISIRRVAGRRAVVAPACGFVCGWLLPLGLGGLLPAAGPAQPYAVLAASFVVNLAGLALMLAWLPAREPGRWVHLRAWALAAAAAAAAHLGLWLAPGNTESLRTFVSLWALLVAEAAGLAALHALLCLPFRRWLWLPRQICLLILGVAVTALFWSRTPIQRADPAVSGKLAAAVMALSPPLAVAAVWHQESDAARAPARSDAARFDLVRGPLTYAVWIGSYQAVAYPALWPNFQTSVDGRHVFQFGLVLSLLIWAVPLMILGDRFGRVGAGD